MASQVYVRRGFLVMAGMVASLALGVYAERLGVFHGAITPNIYRFFDTLVDIRSQILRNYVEPIDDKKLLDGAIGGMMNELDPYSTYFAKDEFTAFDRATRGQFCGIGVELSQDPTTKEFMVVSPLEDSPALKAGMYAGDRILKIDGKSLEELDLKDLVSRISGLPGSVVKITVLHEGEKNPVELSVTRANITVQSVKGWKHLNTGDGSKWDYLIDPEHRIAYVRVTNFMENTPEELDNALKPLMESPEGLKGVVLDLRFNPGGLLSAAIDISDRFLEKGVIVSTRGRDGKDRVVAEAKKEGTYPNVPLVVLINEYSASASEIVSGALSDHHRALLIGNRSFGKGSVQDLITLEGGQSALKLTTAYYYLPSGRNIMRKKNATTWGVEPEPEFTIALSDAENRAVLKARASSEIIRNRKSDAAANGSATRPAPEAASQPTTAPANGVDRQLQRAMEMLLAHERLSGDFVSFATTHPATTKPAATQPATSAPATQP